MRPVLLFALLLSLTASVLAQPEPRPTQTLKGHTGGIFNAAYSPDGKWLASSGKDRRIRIWNSLTGQELRVLEGHGDDVFRVQFSPDGKLLASAGDQTVRIWDPSNGKPLHTLAGVATQYNVAFHPEGKWVAAIAADGHFRVWQLPEGKLLRAIKAHAERGLGIACSPDGRMLVTSASSGGAGAAGETLFWDTTTWQQTGRLHGARGVMTVAFSPSGSTLATGCTDKSVRLWETCTGREVARLQGHTESTYYVAYSPDGRRIASCGGSWNSNKAGEVIVWDIATESRLATLGGFTAPIWSLAYHPDGRELASASGRWNGTAVPGEVRLWSLRDLKDEALTEATPQNLQTWWADLHCDDPGRAFRAGWNLSGGGTRTLELMRAQVRPPRSATAEQIARWFTQLADDDFDTRERASLELEKLGTLVRPAALKALESADAELRRRAGEILERLNEVALSTEEIHALRELDVLGRIGPGAVSLVERYLTNPEGTPVGTEARRVLRTLRQ